MSRKLELSIEGHANDGEILVVDHWPNFKTIPMPPQKIVEHKTFIQQPYAVHETSPNHNWLFLYWLIALTIILIWQVFRGVKWHRHRR